MSSDHPLFETSIVNNRISIDRAFANEFHSLRCIEVKSICDSPLVIKLRSNLGAQLAFQESNENMSPLFIEEHKATIFSIASNTAESAQSNGGYANGILGRQFDPLFNMIGYIDELKLAPFESKIITLVFRPDPKSHMKRKGAKDEDSQTKRREEDEVFEMTEISGMVFLFAYKISLLEDKSMAPVADQNDQTPPDQQV